jgi:predicted dehydrogenase
MSDSLGIGFVGAGFITSVFHAETLKRVRRVHCAGVMNPTVSKAEDVAADLRAADCGDSTAYGDLRELVRDPGVEALWLTGPNHTRVENVEIIVEELRQGGADLTGLAIEKPLARTIGEAREIIDLVDSVSVNEAYLENQVHMPGVTRMRDLLWESGADSGRPYLARSAEEHSGPHSGWFWDPREQGGGVLSDMMCHSHKANKHLLERPEADGDLKPVAVSADISTLKWGREGYADDLLEEYDVDYGKTPAEDYASATVFYETPEGQLVAGEATNSWCFVGQGLRITIELLGPEYSGRVDTLDSGTDVFFSDAAAEEAGYVVEKQEASRGEMSVLPDEPVTYGYLAQNRHVVDAFRTGEDASEDLRDGLEVVKLCMASYKAAEAGERLRFDSLDLDEYVPEPARGEFEAGPGGIE